MGKEGSKIMRTIKIELDPCCTPMHDALISICPVSDSLVGYVRIGVRLGKEQILLYFCPWCGKEINLKVIG